MDLMAWPDLDIYLRLDASEQYLQQFLQLAPRLQSVCDLVSLRFKNHLRYPVEPLPTGLYWGARVNQGPWRWKLDIWALPGSYIESHHGELERLKSKLTPEARSLILGLKQALLTPEGRTPVFSGYHIYCAVLDHGLETLKSIKDYLRSKGVEV